ncbi:MAG: CDC48 family AAA ATPase [Thermoplasmatota archaeon]
MAQEVMLRVSEALSQDVGSGRARLDGKTRISLDVTPGDIVEIKGNTTTAAVVWRARPIDEGKSLIRIDNLTRKNAEVGMGDKVMVRKIEPPTADTVVMAPAISKGQKIQFGQGIEHLVKRGLLKRPVSQGDTVVIPGIALFGNSLPFGVLKTSPKGIVAIGEKTEVEVKEEPIKEGMLEAPEVSYEDIGGLEGEIMKIREMIELPLKHPELFKRLGIDPPKGVLLHGPPGTGKTLIAKAVANESGANFYTINGPEIMSKFYGQSEENLRKTFEEAEKNAPAIVFIDEIDAIASKREEVHGEVERRVVSQMLTLMDGLKGRGNLIVIGATNRVDSLDPAIRRPGRFDREIVVDVPDRQGREEILEIHTRGMPKADDVDLDQLADNTYGFVGADLAALAREAAMNALRRYLPEIDLDEPIQTEVLEKMQVMMKDFREAHRSIEPSALREVMIEIPKVGWIDVGGLDEVKERLKEAVEWPLSNPERFTRLGIKAPRGILLYGPPGTGKTLLAKAVANESNANFLSIKGPEVFSKWVGESEKAVRELFKKAKQSAPSIIFLDEIDALAPRRGANQGSRVTDTVVNQLLTSMDGVESMDDVVVIGATNRPDIIDPSFLRPGRFDALIHVQQPDRKAREEIFRIHMRDMPLTDDVNIVSLAEMSEGFAGADIESVCREAAMVALREDSEATEVANKHFMEAFEHVRPSLDEEMVEYYRQISDKLGKGVAKQEIAKGMEVM